MKRFISLVLVVLFCLTACNTGRIPVREPIEYEGKGFYTVITHFDMLFSTSVSELVDASDLVVRTELVADLGAFNVSEMLTKKGYTNVGVNTICTFYELKVTEVIKGDVSKGDTIVIRIFGGTYNDTLYTSNYSEKLTYDFEYILFLCESIFAEMPYELTNPAQAYLPLREQSLSLNTKISKLSLFKNGQSASSIINTIKKNMSSPVVLAEKKANEELQRARNSLIWQSYVGFTLYKDGYTGEPIRYSIRGDTYFAGETINAFLRAITLVGKLEGTPSNQIYHVGIFDNEGIYMTISLTDNAVLCRTGADLYTGEDTYAWYTYNAKPTGNMFYPNAKTVTAIYNEIANS